MHNPERFEVIFHGELAGKNQVMDVKQQMGEMFQLNAARLEVLFAGEPQVVKRNVTKELAEKYKRAIFKAGGVCIVVPERPQLQTIAPHETGEEDAIDAHMITAQIATCPACGHKQLAADQCNRCNVDMEKMATAIRLRKERERMQELLPTREKAVKPHSEAWRKDLANAVREQQLAMFSKTPKSSMSLTCAGAKWSRLCDKVRSRMARNSA